ncbi:MAG: hypothetical protein ACD_58C00261G0002 [uncultured bacterium]|nr:MAG: hypothetical protein ACD_58C00261G0002 [uncultured bacterium]
MAILVPTNPRPLLQEEKNLDDNEYGVYIRKPKATEILNRLIACKTKNKKTRDDNRKIKLLADEFEKISFDLVKVTCEGEFDYPPNKQQASLRIKGEKGTRSDITLLNEHNSKGKGLIWDTFRKSTEDGGYNCSQIIFECKNYANATKITSSEIHQIHSYLHPEDIGKIGFIINRYGYRNLDQGAILALNRFKLDKYVIIIIGDKDIREWLDLWAQTGSSSAFFAKKYSDYKQQIRSQVNN